MMKIVSLCVCGLVLAAWGVSGTVATPATAVPAQQDVKQVYLDKCAVCHGEDGAAQTARGKKLKMKDIRAEDVQKQTQAQWVDAIVKGVGQDMDAYGKELGADMSRKLADYMRDLSKTKK
jgi:mono/diheme cytochrome c family protein